MDIVCEEDEACERDEGLSCCTFGVFHMVSKSPAESPVF